MLRCIAFLLFDGNRAEAKETSIGRLASAHRQNARSISRRG